MFALSRAMDFSLLSSAAFCEALLQCRKAGRMRATRLVMLRAIAPIRPHRPHLIVLTSETTGLELPPVRGTGPAV